MNTRFSRAQSRWAASTRPAPELRWQILDDLALARTAFGLKDRTLQVLRALLSFLPKGETRNLTVFPSNRTLSDRLLGMPESTLRRHLAHLGEAGLIVRHDSPNRKRYRVGTAMSLTFGLDLAPLFSAAAHIHDAAQKTLQLRQRIAELRARIRAQMPVSDEGTCVTLNKALRRNLSEEGLKQLLETLPKSAQNPDLPPVTTVDDSQNERHIQTPSQSKSVSDPEIVASCAIEEVAAITDHPLRNERDIEKSGRLAALAMSILDAWKVAQYRRGPIWATMALAHVHRRMATLRNPGAYLLSLTKRAEDGQFDLIAALGSGTGRKLTAVNQVAAA